MGVPQLRSYRGRNEGASGLSHLRPSPELLRDPRGELLKLINEDEGELLSRSSPLKSPSRTCLQFLNGIGLFLCRACDIMEWVMDMEELKREKPRDCRALIIIVSAYISQRFVRKTGDVCSHKL